MATKTKWQVIYYSTHHTSPQASNEEEKVEKSSYPGGNCGFDKLNKTPEVRDILGRVLLHAPPHQKMRW